MNAARTHTYVGILPTHKALHPSSLGHWPVDLSGGNQGHLLGTIQLVLHHQHLQDFWVEITIGISTQANISPVGLVISQLQNFNNPTLENVRANKNKV